MSEADKRSVATDALATLGSIIDETAGRDAIHIAVEPVRAGMKLFPGQHVGVADGVAFTTGKHVGIVDPFLTDPIAPDAWFWLFVYPRQIISLRHVWSHPAFPEEIGASPQVDASRRWIENFCAEVGERYDYVMDGARTFLQGKREGVWPDYLYGEHDSGALEGEVVPQEFWTHYQNVTGEKVDPNHRESFFTCSC